MSLSLKQVLRQPTVLSLLGTINGSFRIRRAPYRYSLDGSNLGWRVASLTSEIAFGLHLTSAAEGSEHRQKVLGRLKGSRGMGQNIVFARRGGHKGYQDSGPTTACSPHLNVDATIDGRVSREATGVAGAVVSTALVCNYSRRAQRVCAICTRRPQRQRLRLVHHSNFSYGSS